MGITSKAQIDTVVNAFKKLKAKRRAAVLRSQELQEKEAQKDKEAEAAKAT